jgi:hypothetical protein
MIHAPVQPFFGNWLYWPAGALAPNVALSLRTLALPQALPPRQAAAAGHPQRRRPAGPTRPPAAPALAPGYPHLRCWAANYWGAALAIATGIPSASLSTVLNQLVHDGLVIRIEHGT